MKNIILTGDRPTGRLHIGHYVGSLKQRKRLQDEGNYDEFYIMIADKQALTDNFDNPDKVRDNVIEVMLDYLSIGLDPEKVTFFLQSMVPALSELTEYYMNLVTLPRLMRNPTVKTEIGLRGFDGEERGVPVGFVNYPISQAADITAFNGTLVPVGEDQLPMLEQTREIVRSFNRIYNTDVLVECKEVLPDNATCMRLPGTDGASKMSKSVGNCIYLADDEATIKKKVNSMKTFPRNIDEPGIIEGNVVFTYLDAFCKDSDFEKYYPKFKNLDELKEAYSKGGIGDGKVKSFLLEIIKDELRPIRERRHEYEHKIEEILDILKEGSKKASEVANETAAKVKKAMKIDYFGDDQFKNEQISKYIEVK